MNLIKWKFKEDAQPQGSGDFWYDLTDGGYINPEKLLTDIRQGQELKKAILIVESFEQALIKANLINEDM